jgi:cleavage and polyadenylation specificity factor subunit 2
MPRGKKRKAADVAADGGTKKARTSAGKSAGDIDVGALKVADLRKELKNRGLGTSGRKKELSERLQQAIDDEANVGQAGEEAPAATAVVDAPAKAEEPALAEEAPIQPGDAGEAPREKKEEDASAVDANMLMEEAPRTPAVKPEVAARSSPPATTKDEIIAPSLHVFQVLYGAEGDGPVSYLLETDGVVILLDCGWDERFDETMLAPLKAVAPRVNLVLISHPDLAHVGALPYAIAKLNLKAPVYMTSPVQKMGELVLSEALYNRGWGGGGPIRAIRPDQPFTVEDVQHCFRDCATPLNYSQNLTITGLEKGTMTVTPFAAGHTLGGAVWRISKAIESIVYAVDFNHSKERHLNGTMLGNMQRPALMICGVRNSDGTKRQPKRSKVEKDIMALTLETLRKGGDVLFPVDSAARLLEVLLFFEKTWAEEKGRGAYRVAMVHHQGFHVVDFANYFLSWMSSAVVDELDQNRVKAFDLKYIQITKTLAELKTLPSPKVIFATSEAMEYGHAHDLFGDFAANPSNALILTEPGPENSLARHLATNARPPKKVDFEHHTRAKISGGVLKKWQEAKEEEEAKLATEQEKRTKETELLEFSAEKDAMDAGRDPLTDEFKFQQSSDSSSLAPVDTFQIEAQANLYGAFSKPLYPMFSFRPTHQAHDAYGEVLSTTELEHYTQPFVVGRVIGHDGKKMGTAEVAEAGDGEDKPSAAGDGEDDEAYDSDEEMERLKREQENEQVPVEMTVETKALDVNCQVGFFPMTGIADHKSCAKIIKKVDPTHLIVVGGDSRGLAKATGRKTNIYCGADVRQRLEIKSDTRVYQSIVDDKVLRNMQMSPLGSYEVGVLSAKFAEDQGTLTLVPAEAAAETGEVNEDGKLLRTGVEGGVDWDDVYKPVTIVGVGNVRLASLKTGLGEIGLRAEIREGGVLLTENGVSITKRGPNDFFVEGPLCETYYKARSVLYKRFAFV